MLLSLSPEAPSWCALEQGRVGVERWPSWVFLLWFGDSCELGVVGLVPLPTDGTKCLTEAT